MVYTTSMNSKWYSPLSERVKKTAYMHPNSFVRALSVISPEFVYYYVGQIVTFGLAYVIGTGSYGTEVSAFYKEHSLYIAALIRILAVTLAVVPLIPSFMKEYPVILQKKGLNGRFIIWTVILSVSSSLLFNSLAMVTGFTGTSETFSKTASSQFSLPIWLGIIVYGIVTPITEEIVHRGLIYNRLRRYFNLTIGVLGSSLLFGISHGNRVQLAYGFVMGLMICYVYERYGSFIYPVLFHCFANISVYICMSILLLRQAVTSYAGIMIEAALVIACLAGVALSENIDT